MYYAATLGQYYRAVRKMEAASIRIDNLANSGDSKPRRFHTHAVYFAKWRRKMLKLSRKF